MSLKEHKKAWGGCEQHPLVTSLTERLKERGFSWGSYGDDYSVDWSRSAGFDGYCQTICVVPSPALGRGRDHRRISIGIYLFVESERHAEVEREISRADCIRLAGPFAPSPPQTVTTVFRAHLNWLMARWPPALESFSAAFHRWGDLTPDKADAYADDMCHFIDRQGKDLFDYVGTPERLLNVLLNLPDFPGSVGNGTGPGSADAIPYAAVLLRDLGRGDEAIRHLKDDLRIEEAAYHRGEVRDGYMKIRRCLTAKYIAWINGTEIPTPEVVE